MDAALLDILQAHARSPFMDALMVAVTHLGDLAVVWLAAAAALIAQPKRRIFGIALVVAVVAAAAIGAFLLKPLFGRERPFLAHGFAHLLVPPPLGSSFPSNHSMVSFAAAAALCCLPDKTRLATGLKVAAVTLACLIAFSRLYLYVHYPSDVLAGAVLGVATGCLAVKLTLAASKRFGRRRGARNDR
ncbi:MAG TPA: phosphatase PAP2 family protein [Candidatus Rubneribacter avistercoris]|nr:phosphatase PAP2 family protein [Candidatus Rubneribacter avistercoris]